MEERNLTVVEKGGYKNIKLNEKKTVEVDGEMLQTDKYLLDDGFIVVEKLFEKSLAKTGNYGEYWIAKVKYNEHEDVSFFINRKSDADAFDNLGAVGEVIKIAGKTELSNTGRNFLKLSFTFNE